MIHSLAAITAFILGITTHCLTTDCKQLESTVKTDWHIVKTEGFVFTYERDKRLWIPA